MNSRRNVHLKGTVTLVFFEPLGAPVPKCWHAILKGVKRPTRVDFRFRGQGFTFRSNKKTAKNRHLIHVEDPDSSSHFGCPSFPQLFNMYIYITCIYIYIGWFPTHDFYGFGGEVMMGGANLSSQLRFRTQDLSHVVGVLWEERTFWFRKNTSIF